MAGVGACGALRSLTTQPCCGSALMQAHGGSPLPLTAWLRAEGLQEGGGLGVQ